MSLDHEEGCELSVLIVEDECLIRLDIADHFLNEGWAVLEANNGEEALLLLANGHPVDVVVTDIRLGGTVSGWDVAEAFRASKPFGRVVYTSGNSVEAHRTVTNSVFIRKPYRPDEVLGAAKLHA
jgi:CheY-like chemotaxis protein